MDKIKKISVTQIRSVIGQTKRQKRTVEALGLRKINQTVTHNATPALLGMIKKVEHLLAVKTIA